VGIICFTPALRFFQIRTPADGFHLLFLPNVRITEVGRMDLGGDGLVGQSSVDGQPESSSTSGFVCQLDATKSMMSTVAGIHNGKKDHHACVKVLEESITFATYDTGKNMQGQATLLSNNFSHFDLYISNNKGFVGNDVGGEMNPSNDDEGGGEPSLEFKVNVANFLNCLSIFGAAQSNSTSVRMDYDDRRRTFRLVLQHGEGALTECSMSTLDYDEENTNFFLTFRESNTVGEVIVLSDSLREAFSEIYNLPGAASVYLSLSPSAPYFQISAVGNAGRCDIEFPYGSESFSSFNCEVPKRSKYQLSLLQHALRALGDSHQTYVRMNEKGMLCLQHKLHHGQNGMSFVEFVVLPEESEEDENSALPSKEGGLFDSSDSENEL
jgi:cell cycle checkpoint protein